MAACHSHSRGCARLHQHNILTYSCSYDGDIERLQKVSNTLFEAAEKTKEGARGLVLASNDVNTGISDYFERYQENTEEKTVFHIATTYFEHPEGPLPIFLKWAPDALKYLGESWENSGSHPFHNIFKHCRGYKTLVKSIEAFAQYSSLDGFAAGLLYTNLNDGYCFDRFVQAIEESEVKSSGWGWQLYLANVVDNLLQRRDESGRCLLHHIAAYEAIDNFAEQRGNASSILYRLKQEYSDAGREFPFSIHLSEEDGDDEERGIAILLWWKKYLKKKQEKVGEVARWILNRKESLIYAVDNDGLNPLQYAASVGKKWNQGLSVVAKAAPEWAQQPGNGTLSAFAVAAYSGAELDTVFELLRFDASVLASNNMIDTTTRENECAAENNDERMDDILNSLKPLAKALKNHPNKDIFLSQLEAMRIAAESNLNSEDQGAMKM